MYLNVICKRFILFITLKSYTFNRSFNQKFLKIEIVINEPFFRQKLNLFYLNVKYLLFPY